MKSRSCLGALPCFSLIGPLGVPSFPQTKELRGESEYRVTEKTPSRRFVNTNIASKGRSYILLLSLAKWYNCCYGDALLAST
jgi:hypothetical protein